MTHSSTDPQDDAGRRRALMPDGEWWTVEFRHEMAQLMRRGRERERKLYVFFYSDRGTTRRAEVTDAFKQTASDADLRGVWHRAEQLDAGGAAPSNTY